MGVVYHLSLDIIPRSVLMVELGGACYLLCALGDGCLHYYTMDSETGMKYESMSMRKSSMGGSMRI